MNSTRELDKQIAKILYGNDLVFSDDNMLMATSTEALQRSIEGSCLFVDTIIAGDEEVFCLRLPEWSSKIETAWELVRRMIKVCEAFSIEPYLDGWIVRYEMDTKSNTIGRVSECKAISECFIEVFKE